MKNENLAKIAINKSLLKEYSLDHSNRIVYMNDDTEFQIQLFNPYNYTIGVKIYLNNESISHSYLVLRPGERVWLDRYFDKNNKFKFSTYYVENSEEAKKAIANNGNIKIEFYKELIRPNNWTISTPLTSTPITTPWLGDNIVYCGDGKFNNIFQYSNSNLVNENSFNYKSIQTYATSSIETGRIEEGGHSDQQFTNTYIDFEYFPFSTERINILPISRKHIEKSDIVKRYCVECGRKIKEKFKYCPFCGTKQ